jgi:hypothetical protein
VPLARVEVARVPVARVPVARVPVARVPVARVPVARVPVARVEGDSATAEANSFGTQRKHFLGQEPEMRRPPRPAVLAS